jgi:hypothetical protein
MFFLNYPKAIGLASYACNTTFSFYNPDLTVNTSYTKQSKMGIKYDENTGAYVMRDDNGRIMAEEFCDGKGGICVVDHEDYLAPFHTESYTITRGEKGNAARLIQSYEKTGAKVIRRAQHFIPRKTGAQIVVWIFDENERFMVSAVQDCLKVHGSK